MNDLWDVFKKDGKITSYISYIEAKRRSEQTETESFNCLADNTPTNIDGDTNGRN